MCLWFDLLSSDVASCEVICGTTPVLLCTTKNYNVLLQYYSNELLCTTKYYASTTLYYKVLERITPVLLCTTKYYASTTLYYKVLERTTPVLLCTTKYYSSTTLYYKVLLQYYSVLQSTTPVLLCTTPVLQCTTPVLLWNVIYNARRNKSHRPTSPNTAPATQNECLQWSASHMKHHFQCAEQQEPPSNFTKYCACHAKWMSSMICVTYETSFPMRGASKVTLQPHQILHLPRNLEVHYIVGKSLKCFRHLPPIERRFDDIRRYPSNSEHNPTIKSSSRTRRFQDLTRPILETILNFVL